MESEDTDCVKFEGTSSVAEPVPDGPGPLPSQESQGAGLIRDPVLVSDLPNEFSAELFEDRLNNRIFLAFVLHVFVWIDVRGGLFGGACLQILAYGKREAADLLQVERPEVFHQEGLLIIQEALMERIRHPDRDGVGLQVQRKRQENPVIQAIFEQFGGELVW